MPYVADWDWCTIAVFTCSASCGSEAAAWRREQVLLVNESDCHIGAAAAAAPPRRQQQQQQPPG